MNYDDIKDLYDLADYLNGCESWPYGIESLCEERGWTYYNNPWDVASCDGELVTLSKHKVYEVVSIREWSKWLKS